MNASPTKDWEKHNLDKPDLIKVNEDGEEEWFYLHHLAGKDDEGVYMRVLEGPAEGERCYL